MATNGPYVKVIGDEELQTALYSLDPSIQRTLDDTARDVASWEADNIRSAGFALGSVAALAAESVQATGYGIEFGGDNAPYALGAEFGAYQYHQFLPWLGSGSDSGYFVYPTIRDDSDEREDKFTDAVNALLDRAFPD